MRKLLIVGSAAVAGAVTVLVSPVVHWLRLPKHCAQRSAAVITIEDSQLGLDGQHGASQEPQS